MAKIGRPRKYTDKLAAQICGRIASSNTSLKKICDEVGVSVVTVFSWLHENPEFLNQYARAREAQADFLADEMLEIADDATRDTIITEEGAMIENKEWTNRSKLRVDARKWIASKLKPKKYGDRIDLEHTGNVAITWNEERTYERPSEDSAQPSDDEADG